MRRIIESMVRGDIYEKLPADDIQYCLDLRLIAHRDDCLEIAKPIDQEVIPEN